MTDDPTSVRVVAAATVVVLLVSVVALALPEDDQPIPETARDQPPAGTVPSAPGPEPSTPPTSGPSTPTAAPSPTAPPEPPPALATARSFLDVYVAPDGRVVRHDEGGDTVSEGQAWALLLAVAVEDETRAESIVSWTEEHLQGSDGLLAWRWADDAVVDPEPAADADLVWSWALSLGAEQFGRPRWQVRAEDHVRELASTSAVSTDTGPILAAGPWATGDPAVVNPSYLWPAALRWAESVAPTLDGTTAASHALLARLVDDDTPLVPNWLELASDGTPTSIAGPGQDGADPVHGFDAVRTWVWLAADCDRAWQELAASAAPALDVDSRHVAALHALDGSPMVDWQHPAVLAGAAAAAHAAGDDAARNRLLVQAHRLGSSSPSYYGSAVVALTEVLLLTDRIPTCEPSGG